MTFSSRLTNLTAACVAALSLLAGILRADDHIECHILPAVELPADLSQILSEGSGTVWYLNGEGESDQLGSWDYSECDQIVTIWLEDNCMIAIDLTQASWDSGSGVCFHWTKIDPSLAVDPHVDASIVAQGEILFWRYEREITEDLPSVVAYMHTDGELETQVIAICVE